MLIYHKYFLLCKNSLSFVHFSTKLLTDFLFMYKHSWYSQYWSIIKFVYWKYILLLCNLFFPSLKMLFE